MPEAMGLGQVSNACFRRKYQWAMGFTGLEDISPSGGDAFDFVSILPPLKAARPSLSFKEIAVEHLNETIYFAGKPDWKPISVTLYDVYRGTGTKHPIMQWLYRKYVTKGIEADPEGWFTDTENKFKITEATIYQLDGCGNLMEQWVFENPWPQTIEFGDLDYSNSEVLTCELTLRYDRAFYEPI